MKILHSILLITIFLLSSCGQGVKVPDNYSDNSNILLPVTCLDGFCRIFVSATNMANGDYDTDNDLNGIEEADDHCQNDANHPGIGTYKALIVDATNRVACTTPNCSGGPGEHIDWIFYANADYRQIDGLTPIGTTTANGTFAFPLTNSVSTVGAGVWTGISGDWRTNVDNCQDWTSSGGGDNGRSGVSIFTNSAAIDNGLIGCNNTTVIYCVEQ